jgi:hypothetical protein
VETKGISKGDSKGEITQFQPMLLAPVGWHFIFVGWKSVIVGRHLMLCGWHLELVGSPLGSEC